jgi:hypothetical protein
MRASRGDLTTVEVVLSGLDTPIAVAADTNAVYWASKTAVFRLAKGETVAEAVATGFTEVTQIGVHGSTLYGVGPTVFGESRAGVSDWCSTKTDEQQPRMFRACRSLARGRPERYGP